ncbi:MAG: alpha-mannosidase, partial [Clostridia bacterium]|nr:alpha-mannosidase [Clostridia bacterium]
KQTRQKAGRSFATVINFMKEYPEYKFMSSQAQLYDFVKQDYPELYDDIKDAVSRGQWEPEGGMWVEADTNVISGESLVRQFLVGKRFFRKEFGKDNKILWLPDVFGYSGALPQIMKLAGIDYFMTTKISWSEFDKFPFDTFNWKGIDGTRILSHFIPSADCANRGWTTTYNAQLRPDLVIGGWRRYSNKNLNKNVLMSFGHGDGGGGPTRGQIECGLRMAKGVPGCPEVKMEFSRDFFERLKKDVSGNPHLPEWAGELYLEFHRGTLTSQSRNKRFNRKSELLYHDIETLAETANIFGTGKYPYDELLEGWKTILINQFHDIIPGSSIAAVYEDSKEDYLKLLSEGGTMVQSAASSVAMKASTKGDSYVVENTLGFERSEVVITDAAGENLAVYDEDGSLLPSQKTFDGKLAFLAKNVPSKGFKVFRIGDLCGEQEKTYCADINGAENDYYKFVFDGDMNIASLYHKESGRFVAPEGETLGRLFAYEDIPHSDEAWDIKCYYGEKYSIINDVQSKDVVESGPVRTVVRIVRKYNLSTITQYYIFYPNTTRIDIVYDVDWKEKKVLLKGDYPVDVNANTATFDIQFGNLQRPAHSNTTWDYAQFEVCGHKWADLSDNGFGFSVLNDCKYGWTVKNGRIKPSMLRSQVRPNHLQDRERHDFTYALYPHSGAVSTSYVVQEAYSLNVPLYCVRVKESRNGIGSEFSLVNADKSNIIIETVKKAEDSDAL